MKKLGFSRASFPPSHFALGISRIATYLVFTGVFAVASLPVSTKGATLTIRPDGTGDYPTIQEALWYATDGDIIELADGIFQGDLNRDIDFRDKAVTVRSASGDPVNVVIDCGLPAGTHSGFLFERTEGAGSMLEGVTVRNAMAGVFFDQTSPILRNCRFEDCATAVRILGGASRVENCVFHGGGTSGVAMFINGATTAQIVDCTFQDHTGPAVNQTAGSPTFDGCLFQDNRPGINGHSQANPTVNDCDFVRDGFALFSSESPTIRDCRFTDGSGSISSGTVENCTFSDSHATSVLVVGEDATVRSSRFERNQTLSGVIRVGGGAASIQDCEFWDNTGIQGGAVSGEFSAARFEDCLFVRNSATQGGCAYLRSSPATFIRCTIVECSSSAGSAFYLDGADPVLENTIVAFGSGSEPFACINAAAPILICCDVYGTSDSDWDGCLAGQLGERGNISADPLFCGPESDDYTLAASSPATEEHSGCGRMGALPVACSDPVPTVQTSWGGVKARFREVF